MHSVPIQMKRFVVVRHVDPFCSDNHSMLVDVVWAKDEWNAVFNIEGAGRADMILEAAQKQYDNLKINVNAFTDNPRLWEVIHGDKATDEEIRQLARWTFPDIEDLVLAFHDAYDCEVVILDIDDPKYLKNKMFLSLQGL